MKFDKHNFFRSTYCEFKMQDIDFFKEKVAHFQSKSGSYYFYTDKGVFRYSNHWGRVANCRWKIKGIEAYKNQNYYVGYANWNDFYALNSIEKVFYITVNFETKQTKICRVKEEDDGSPFLMTSEFAHQRLKQVQMLFKEYKWAKYFEEDIEVLRVKIITKMINSTVPLQLLKQELKTEFN
ncbi:conserved hypothetical protein [Tenacibaculum maritimum]|uniref:hypothetical protein n=1 Tax=Tenacibaculum maritimum TaxID=107401 RepID=UPI0012E5C3A9|nr:hypothetical protein [Tenacibaculum maritimum]CAA0166790.1 conserved hypothetical protein [Tenacibaculum maritimum]